MLKGIDLTETIDFISATDDPSNPTVFRIGNITQGDGLKLFTSAMTPDGKTDLSKVNMLEVVKKSLRSIKNWNGYDLSPVPNDVIESIHPMVVLELFGKIMEINFPSGQETKN